MEIKKPYKTPALEVAEIEDDFICEMDCCSKFDDELATEGMDLAKERKYVDFSDDESIW